MTTRKGRDGSLLTIDSIGALICLALTALAYFGAVYPHAASAQARSDRQEELEHQTTTARQLSSSRAALNRRVKAAREKLSDNALPLEPTTRLNQRLARLGDLATECGLGLEEIHVGEITPGKHYQTVPLELKCQAEFPQTVLFLHRLHHTAPDVGLWSFTLSGNPRSTPSTATAELDLTWYAAPEID